MYRTLQILFLALLFLSCEKKDIPNRFRYDLEVIAVFTPDGIGDKSDAGLIYRGIVKATDSLGLSFQALYPLTFEDGAKVITELASKNRKGYKRLIIATDSEYSSYLRKAAIDGKIIDTDSTKLLVLDGELTHPNIYTAYIPFYGLMYKAGYIASKMSDVDSVKMYLATSKYLYMREGRDGFIDGFTQNRENSIDVEDLSIELQSDTDGFNMRDVAYTTYSPKCKGRYDMVFPLCGETIMGFLRYNREFPGSFYTIGIESDMSPYSKDLPFSCVEYLDKILSSCIYDWAGNRLEHFKKYGLEENWVEIVISEHYKELEKFSEEIHQQAIKKENESYAN